MKTADTIRSVWWATTSTPSRTLAQIGALAAGVTAVVLSATILNGFSYQIERLAFGDYARALVVRSAMNFDDGMPVPPSKANLALVMERVEGIQSTASWAFGITDIQHDSEYKRVFVYGVMGDYQRELDTPVAAGKMLSDEQTSSLGRECLVGADLAEQLGGKALLDTSLRVGGANCKVVGILGEPRSRPARRYAGAIIAPFATARRYYLSTENVSPDDIDQMTLFFKEGTDMLDAKVRTDVVLRKARGVPQSRPSPFEYEDPLAPAKEQLAQRNLLSRLLLTLTAVTLIAGIIGYGAVASGATLARQREIALRMSVGARPKDIVVQFMAEHALLGLAGGLIGLLAGLVLGVVASTFWGWPFQPSLMVTGMAIGLGLATGLTLGAVLSRRAAKASPALAAKS